MIILFSGIKQNERVRERCVWRNKRGKGRTAQHSNTQDKVVNNNFSPIINLYVVYLLYMQTTHTSADTFK